MLPVKTNLSGSGCSPVSSNCVVWEGSCIQCLNVSTGDTISSVVAQLATQICTLNGSIGLTDIDFSCLVNTSLSTPQPSKTLSSFLTLIISKVCTIDSLVAALTDCCGGGGVITPITVATCFQTPDLSGDPILTMLPNAYIQAIGNKVCTIASTVSTQGTTIANHETRITTLEHAAPSTYVLPNLTPVCIYGGDTTPKRLDLFVGTLEAQYCALVGATGSASNLLLASGKQCASLNSAPQLSNSGTMSGLVNWKSTVGTVADSLNNIWLTICDIRTAVAAVQLCCSKTCADVIIDFLANITSNGATIQLYFSGYTVLPSGFVDCAGPGSQLTISDGVGGTYSTFINLVAASSTTTPISINLSATALDPTGNYTFTLASCITNSIITCNKTVIKTATGTPVSCVAPTNVTATLS